MKFYVGLHHPGDAGRFERAFVSINAVRGRRKPIAGEWILDSGAFSEIARFGGFRHGVEVYAAEVNRLAMINPGLVAAVSQDFMCEPWMIEKTGLSVAEHQRLTIERYDALLLLVPGVYVMPVLQGYTAGDYVRHLVDYGERLAPGAWVGVGSVCKRNASPFAVEVILSAIKTVRPDLRLHGFGLKATALGLATVRDQLYSADSMAWSFAARKAGRNGNCWTEAARFVARIETMPIQEGWAF